MKNIIAVSILSIFSLCGFAQERYNSGGTSAKPKSKGFDPQKVVIGGNITGGLSGNFFSVGVSPMIGYSLTPNFIAGVSLGYQYTSIKDDNSFFNTTSNRYESFPSRYSLVSPGVWIRANFLTSFFAQVQFENHFGRIRWTGPAPFAGGSGVEKVKANYSIPTLIVGAGYRIDLGARATAYFGASYDVLQASTERIVTASNGAKLTAYSPYYGQIRPMVGFGFGF